MYGQKSCGLKIVGQMVFGQNDIGRNVFGRIVLHPGARPHIADVVKEQLMDWRWKVLDHPPYSPDISPCDFHLFPLMKEPLRGIRFESVKDINDAVFHGLQELQKKD